MKKIVYILFSVFATVLSGGFCFAALHPVEGSDNFLETDDVVDSGCVDLQFAFVRGSGAEHQKSDIWLKFRDAMTDLAQRRNYTAKVLDIPYPAVSVTDPISNALGAYVSAGEYYRFGKSVNAGVE